MGQAQLLLIVLGVVLVGIAIIAGITAYTQNSIKGNIDAQIHDIMRVGSDIQTWAQKPLQFGGPAVRGDMTDVTFTLIGYIDATTPTTWDNINAAYTLGNGVATATISGLSDDFDPDVQVIGIVCGMADDDIRVAVGTTAPSCL